MIFISVKVYLKALFGSLNRSQIQLLCDQELCELKKNNEFTTPESAKPFILSHMLYSPRH